MAQIQLLQPIDQFGRRIAASDVFGELVSESNPSATQPVRIPSAISLTPGRHCLLVHIATRPPLCCELEVTHTTVRLTGDRASQSNIYFELQQTGSGYRLGIIAGHLQGDTWDSTSPSNLIRWQIANGPDSAPWDNLLPWQRPRVIPAIASAPSSGGRPWSGGWTTVYADGLVNLQASWTPFVHPTDGMNSAVFPFQFLRHSVPIRLEAEGLFLLFRFARRQREQSAPKLWNRGPANRFAPDARTQSPATVDSQLEEPKSIAVWIPNTISRHLSTPSHPVSYILFFRPNQSPAFTSEAGSPQRILNMKGYLLMSQFNPAAEVTRGCPPRRYADADSLFTNNPTGSLENRRWPRSKRFLHVLQAAQTPAVLVFPLANATSIDNPFVIERLIVEIDFWIRRYSGATSQSILGASANPSGEARADPERRSDRASIRQIVLSHFSFGLNGTRGVLSQIHQTPWLNTKIRRVFDFDGAYSPGPSIDEQLSPIRVWLRDPSHSIRSYRRGRYNFTEQMIQLSSSPRGALSNSQSSIVAASVPQWHALLSQPAFASMRQPAPHFPCGLLHNEPYGESNFVHDFIPAASIYHAISTTDWL